MRCRAAEKRILWSLDGRLDERKQAALDDHLGRCPACRQMASEYRSMLSLLRNGREEEPPAAFWTRLEPRLREEANLAPLVIFERWSLRSLPVFFILVLIAAGFFVLTPAQSEPWTSSEVLLIENVNPMPEVRTIFEAEKPATRNMRLIFVTLEDNGSARRQRP